jgi:hypothetical protein
MALTTETFPLEVTGDPSGRIADKISRHIDSQRKKGLKFLGGIPVSWLMFDPSGHGPGNRRDPVPVKFIMMAYEGES